MTRTTLIVALLATTGAPAFAQPVPPAQQAQTAAKSNNPDDKVVCRFINTTGSRLSGEHVCKTRAQWAREADMVRDEFENGPRRPSGDPTPFGPG